MHGQKQIYMFLLIIIFIMALNFCRKAIKRDKELKQHRDDDLKRKIDIDIINQKIKFELLLQQQEIQRQKNIINRMYYQKDKCFDLYIFGNKLNDKNDITLKNKEDNLIKDGIESEATKDKLYKDEIKQNTNIKTKKNNTFFEPINYLFVLVLIYFLIKAITDIKQHYKLKTEEVKHEDGRRRYSLQNYAERKNLKVVNRATIFKTINNFDKHTTKQFDEHRRLSGIIIPSDNKISDSTGIKIESGLTFKAIASKKNPLLRRCSVPILTTSITNNKTTNFRQASIDSYSTDYDSSPDMKRRVRMIQRH